MRSFYVFLLCCLSSSVWAQSESESESEPESESQSPNVWDARLGMEVFFSGYGPAGELGFGVEASPIPALAIMAGVGKTTGGWRLGLGVRGQYAILPNLGLGLEAWYSAGPDRTPLLFTGDNFGIGTAEAPYLVIWDMLQAVRFGFSIEYRASNGFRLRGFGGVAIPVHATTPHCAPYDCLPEDALQSVLPYLGIAIGFARASSSIE